MLRFKNYQKEYEKIRKAIDELKKEYTQEKIREAILNKKIKNKAFKIDRFKAMKNDRKKFEGEIEGLNEKIKGCEVIRRQQSQMIAELQEEYYRLKEMLDNNGNNIG